jgi:hypothetical protein
VAVLIIAATVWGTQKYFDHVAADDKLKASVAQQTLTQQTTVNQQLAETAKQALAQSQQIAAQVAVQNAQLLGAIATRNQQTVNQQQVDAALPPPELAARWVTLVPGTTDADIKPTDAGYYVSPQAAVQTTETLEKVPTLTQNVVDLTTQAANKDREITSDLSVIATQTGQVAGLQEQIKDGNVLCKAEVASVKAAARKSRLKWLGAGYVLGWVSAVALKVF